MSPSGMVESHGHGSASGLDGLGNKGVAKIGDRVGSPGEDCFKIHFLNNLNAWHFNKILDHLADLSFGDLVDFVQHINELGQNMLMTEDHRFHMRRRFEERGNFMLLFPVPIGNEGNQGIRVNHVSSQRYFSMQRFRAMSMSPVMSPMPVFTAFL